MKKFFFTLATFFRKIGRKLDWKNAERYKLVHRWRVENGDTKLRTTYSNLNPDSLVLDLGGFEGDWSSDIYSRYCCDIHLFEPMPTYASNIRSRFYHNQDIKVHEFGLGNRDFKTQLSMGEESSSQYVQSTNMVDVEIRDILGFMEREEIDRVHLMKINIEGGEFDLLEFMLSNDIHKKIDNLQIQFHHFVPHATERMRAIQNGLQKTHSLTYQYEFLWENWRLNN